MFKFFIIPVLAYVAAGSYIYFNQRDLIFARHEVENHTLSEKQKLIRMTSGEVGLAGSISKGLTENQPIILHFGGNAQDVNYIVGAFIEELPEYFHAGVNYRGYVDSEGVPSEKAILADALNFYDEMKLRYKPSHIWVHGYSLGSGVASYVASQRDVEGVLLTVPYDSITSVGQGRYPWLPVDMLIQHRFDNVKHLQGNQTPLAVFSVADDEVIPKKHTNYLKTNISPILFEYEFSGVAHGDVLEQDNWGDLYKQALQQLH